MKEKYFIAIKNFVENGDFCEWTIVTVKDHHGSAEFISREKYQTNPSGCGIYKDDREIESPESFKLVGRKRKKEKILKYFQKKLNESISQQEVI